MKKIFKFIHWLFMGRHLEELKRTGGKVKPFEHIDLIYPGSNTDNIGKPK